MFFMNCVEKENCNAGKHMSEIYYPAVTCSYKMTVPKYDTKTSTCTSYIGPKWIIQIWKREK